MHAHPLLMAFGPHLLLAALEGLVTSAVLALTALGLSLVFGVMRVVNVAHGEFFMLGAVLAWCVSTADRRPSGARLPGRAGRQPAGRRRRRAGRRAAGAAPAQLQSGSHDRRHDRPALHHPAAGADLLRAGGAAGRGAVQLPHPVARGSAIPATSWRSSPHRSLLLARDLVGADAHPDRPRHARHAI